MFNVSTIKPGQRITVHYSSEPSWARKTNNPFLGIVEKFVSVSFTAAGAETYEHQLEKRGDSLTGKPCWHTTAPEIGPCIRVHRQDPSKVYVAGINHNFSPTLWLVNGQQATSYQVNEINQWLRHTEIERGLDFRLWTVEKLENAVIE